MWYLRDASARQTQLQSHELRPPVVIALHKPPIMPSQGICSLHSWCAENLEIYFQKDLVLILIGANLFPSQVEIPYYVGEAYASMLLVYTTRVEPGGSTMEAVLGAHSWERLSGRFFRPVRGCLYMEEIASSC